MVGLYKDPKGETITTFGTSGPREEAVDTSGSSKDKELLILRRRVSQLETCLKQQVYRHKHEVHLYKKGKFK